MIRVLTLVLLFGLGVEALGGGPVGVIISGTISLFLNFQWKRVDAENHRRSVVADEQLRMDVRARRKDEGRQP